MWNKNCLQLYVRLQPHTLQQMGGKRLIREVFETLSEPLQVEIRLNRLSEVSNHAAHRLALGTVPHAVSSPGVELCLSDG